MKFPFEIKAGQVIVLAGRPGMGKTSFAVWGSLSLAYENIPVGYFSLEMSKDILKRKYGSNILKIPFIDLMHSDILKNTSMSFSLNKELLKFRI